MQTLILSPPAATTDRITIAVFVAVVLHAIVVLGVSFEPEPRPTMELNSLDIVLVQQRTEDTPEDAKLLAQANNDGGGEEITPERPATPIPTPLQGRTAEVVAASPVRPPTREPLERTEQDPLAAPLPEPDAVVEPMQQEPEATDSVLSQTDIASDEKVQISGRPRPRAKPRRLHKPVRIANAAPQAVETPQQQNINVSRLVSRSLAMASLSAEVDRKLNAYAERPRSKWISARTRELKYASYMEAWRSKVERIGNLNYPDEARRKSLSGKLVLDVALTADGSLQSVRLRRSSGQRVLDDAALRIVRLAAPYAPFPPSFKNEVDVLHIERTWRFLGSNGLAAR